MNPYNPQEIEEKWLHTWEENHLFQGTATNLATKPLENKFYALFAFAYPSGSGLHVGHVESKTALDILVRYLRMQGKDVFFPVGWDAFGLPAENYAIKTGVPPATTTRDAINTFRRQIKRVGISYDWETEIATCHPGYYKWTQWIFVQLFKAGLAYRDTGWVNWCPSCKTVLANEQVVNGTCERCGSAVIQKELEQWKFKITKYQDELLDGLETVDWPKATKDQQINWIGKSKGLSIDFALQEKDITLTVWTKFWETVFGVTFVVIAPEKFNELELMDLVPTEQQSKVSTYLDAAFHKTEEQRRIGEKHKTGVDTGLKVKNPVNGDLVPLYVADYVLRNVGTGVVMGVPSHDERDFAFAKKFNLPCIQVVSYADGELNAKVASGESWAEGEGTLLHSGSFDGQSAWGEGKTAMAEWMIQTGVARWQTTYKLRDWLISRQRYWGAPIPMVYCDTCAKAGKGEHAAMPGWYSIQESALPVVLPEVPDFRPTDDGKSPIEKAPDDWKYTACPGCGGQAKREVDTMDTFVDSSWYYLRYAFARDASQIFDPTVTNALLPVDMYLIGPEHIVLHLLYARFFTKFLRDQGFLSFDEPFQKMRHQGMILGPDGKKMSKSKGNVINPDDVIEKFGADTLRVYEMFMGPLDADKAWDMRSVAGVYRFLNRFHTLFGKNHELLALSPQTSTRDPLRIKLHWAIDKVGKDLPELKFNTAIAALMELLNVWQENLENRVGFTTTELEAIAKLLAPVAPFLAEELWSGLSKSTSIHLESWPEADASMLTQTDIEIAVQVNGKVKLRLQVPIASASNAESLKQVVSTDSQVLELLGSTTPKKVIAVPKKLVNLVV